LDFTLKTSLQFVLSSSVKWWVCTTLTCISSVFRISSIRNHTLCKCHVSIFEPITYL
jgi:hypothetical protein